MLEFINTQKKFILLFVLISIILINAFSCIERNHSNILDPASPDYDTENPTVSIKYPLNNSNVDSIAIIIADAYDNKSIQKIKFYIDDHEIFSDNSQPYEYEWNTLNQDGRHTIQVKAYDNANNEGESEIINVIVLNNVIIPLEVGNLWHYEIEDLYNQFSIDYSEITIESKQKLNNQDWFYRGFDYVSNDEFGNWSFIGDQSVDNKELEFMYPAVVGQSWTRKDGLTRDVLSIDAVIQVFGQTYWNCMKYNVTISSNLSGIYYVKPNLGIVRIEIYSQDILVLVYRLKDYVIN